MPGQDWYIEPSCDVACTYICGGGDNNLSLVKILSCLSYRVPCHVSATSSTPLVIHWAHNFTWKKESHHVVELHVGNPKIIIHARQINLIESH